MWSSRKVPPEVRSALPLQAGERVLASSADASGRPLVGTQFALYVGTDDVVESANAVRGGTDAGDPRDPGTAGGPGGIPDPAAESDADTGGGSGDGDHDAVPASTLVQPKQPEQPHEPGQRSAASADAASADTAPGVRRIPWEQVERAEWDRDAEVLRVREVAAFGEPVHVSTLVVPQPEPLLQLIRERVTASIVFSQSISVGSGEVRVVGRRRPGSDDPLAWSFVFDVGVDPHDPQVRAAAEQALAEARSQVGE